MADLGARTIDGSLVDQIKAGGPEVEAAHGRLAGRYYSSPSQAPSVDIRSVSFVPIDGWFDGKFYEGGKEVTAPQWAEFQRKNEPGNDPGKGSSMDGDVGRTRINFTQDAKGFVKLDVTAEYATPEETAENLAKAVDAARKVAADKGLAMLTTG